MSQEEVEFSSSRFWKSPNTLDEDVPPALNEDPAANERRIREIVEGEAAENERAVENEATVGNESAVSADEAARRHDEAGG